MTTHSKLCYIINKSIVGMAIPCKDPRGLHPEELKSGLKFLEEKLATAIMKSIKPCSCLSCVVEMNVGALYSRKFYGFKDCPYCEGRGWVIKDKE